MDKKEQAKKILEKYNQSHIKIDNETIAEQIIKIDFKQLKRLYKQTKTDITKTNTKNIKPVKAINQAKLDKDIIEDYKKIGEKEIRNGKFAIVVMAGGQGTRLGHKGPKGTFEIELNSKKKSLFEIIIDKLKDAKENYNISIPCYIMTSPENNNETVAFFEKKGYFGYPKDYIKFFKQGELPLLDKQGRLVLGENGLIKLASDGNGGIFTSMAKSGIIKDMKEKNIKWVFIGAVDNILVKYIDTLLLGLAIKENIKIATRTVIKDNPYEKVGVFCKKDGKVKVIEYTELPEQMRLALDENGELLYGESHIMCNLYNIKAIEKASKNKLKYHIAQKKANYIDENGKLVIPDEPNCYKFEKFIFDSFSIFSKIAILRGIREEDFAPIKNADGVDSPETAKKLYEKYMEKMNIILEKNK